MITPGSRETPEETPVIYEIIQNQNGSTRGRTPTHEQMIMWPELPVMCSCGSLTQVDKNYVESGNWLTNGGDKAMEKEAALVLRLVPARRFGKSWPKVGRESAHAGTRYLAPC